MLNHPAEPGSSLLTLSSRPEVSTAISRASPPVGYKPPAQVAVVWLASQNKPTSPANVPVAAEPAMH